MYVVLEVVGVYVVGVYVVGVYVVGVYVVGVYVVGVYVVGVYVVGVYVVGVYVVGVYVEHGHGRISSVWSLHTSDTTHLSSGRHPFSYPILEFLLLLFGPQSTHAVHDDH